VEELDICQIHLNSGCPGLLAILETTFKRIEEKHLFAIKPVCLHQKPVKPNRGHTACGVDTDAVWPY
jgi:hypothetical protein